MQTIIISPKNAITQGIRVSCYINPNSNHNTLMINGLSMQDLVSLRDYQLTGAIHNNCCCIDLKVNNFTIL